MTSHADIGLAEGGNVNSYNNDVRELPGQILWPEPNGQQFNIEATDLFFDVNVTRITPAVVDENSKSPSFTSQSISFPTLFLSSPASSMCFPPNFSRDL